MRPLIFLDVDGVLNGHEWDAEVMCGQIHPDKVARLNRILRETDARIVLSSAWRYIVHRGEANMMGMEWLLRSHGVLANRLIGITRMDLMRANPNYDGTPASWPQLPGGGDRAEQVREWLAINRPGPVPYVVIDDLDLGFTEAGHPFVRTDGKVGLTDADAERAIALLGEAV